MRYDHNVMADDYCIVCGAPAEVWFGHFHYRNTTISAGWCDQHYWEYTKSKPEEWFLPIKECRFHGEGCYGREGEFPFLVEEKEREDNIKRAKERAGY